MRCPMFLSARCGPQPYSAGWAVPTSCVCHLPLVSSVMARGSLNRNESPEPMHGLAAAAEPASSASAGPAPAWRIDDAGWRDVPGMVNIVAAAAAQGFFAPALLDVRYQIGLALQLFSAVLRRRMAVPGQPATRASVRVVRDGRMVLGFSLVRALPDAAAAPHLELHLLAVTPDARGMGVGGALLRDGVSRLAADGSQCLLLSTSSKAEVMKRMLRRMGAPSLGTMPSGHGSRQSLEVFALGACDVLAWQKRAWRAWLGAGPG